MGGGGGGGRDLTPEETRRLSEHVAEIIKNAAKAKKNVFISFAEENLDEVNLLRGRAKNENSDIEFNDWSLKAPFDSSNSEYIRNGIRERIQRCSVPLVYLSPEAAKSKWVDWEIRESLKLGKSVVAMHKGEKALTGLPSAVVENGVKVVTWSQAELAAAIASAK